MALTCHCPMQQTGRTDCALRACRFVSCCPAACFAACYGEVSGQQSGQQALAAWCDQASRQASCAHNGNVGLLLAVSIALSNTVL